MTIAILRENGDLIWFDAIKEFRERYSGAVSSHPLESGGLITDHTTTNNLVLELSGIISDADFNLSRPTITDDDSRDWKINNKQFVNNSPVTSYTTISMEPSISKFLPESIAQFVGTTAPVVTVPDSVRPKYAAKIQSELTQMAGGVVGLVDAKGRPKAQEVFSLVDFRDGKIWRVIDNCVMTSLDFSEDPTTGDAIFPVMTIERVVFSTTKSTTVPKTTKKGRKNGTPTVRTEKSGDDPKSGPTSHTKGSSEERDISSWLDAASKFNQADDDTVRAGR